jgi:hypothetical protein
MNVASLDLCKELYELSGWNIGERRRAGTNALIAEGAA